MNGSNRILKVCIAAASVAVTACGTHASSASDVDARTVGRPPVAVTVTVAAAADMSSALEVVGSLTPKFSADVKSEVTGVVTDLYVAGWVSVKKGALLARLETSEIEAAIEAMKAAEAQTRVLEARARREHERAVQLHAYGLITTQALDDARTALEAAEAGSAAARAQIRTAEARLAKSFIRSPMDGVVALRRVSVGDRVENMGGGEPMFRMVDNRTLDLTVTVASARLADIRIGQPLSFTTDAVPNRTFAGTVMFINPAVDEINRSARVVASVPNADNALRSGLFVRGRILVSWRMRVLQVEREALVNWSVRDRTAELFIVENGHAQKRTVKTGEVVDGSVEIAEGLAEGELVVTRGGFALRGGDRVTIANDGEGA